MSKNLTQLAYDIASFYNLPVEEAMQKLKSGIAGELEPLRSLGYDLSQAKLESIAMSYGINQSVSSMTQASKSMLRYQAIMTQVTQVQGDMSRTLEAPANQLRVLQAAANQAARALGNMFIPALNAILPAAIALLNVIRTVANAIANLFGFQLADVDYGGLKGAASSASDIESSLGGGAGSAKKMRDYLMGIDELNVINEPAGGGGGGGGGGLADLTNMQLTGYDFLGDALSSKIAGIQSKLEGALPVLQKIFGFIWDVRELIIAGVAAVAISKLVTKVAAGWKVIKGLGIVKGFMNLRAVGIGIGPAIAGSLRTAGKRMTDLQRYTIGAVAAVAEFAIVSSAVKGMVDGTKKLGVGFLELAVAIGAAGAALYLAFGPTGIAVAAVVAVVGAIVGLVKGTKELAKKAYEASDGYARMSKIIETSEGVISRSADIMERLAAGTERLNSVETEWGAIDKLVDRIFDLNEKVNLSDSEFAELQAKVYTLNSMGLEGLQLTIDETTGRVLETRDAIDQVIEKLKEQARTAAATELLTQSYKDQAQAAQDYYSAYDAYTEAVNEASSAEREYLDLKNELQKTWGNNIHLAEHFVPELAEMKLAYESATESVDKANEALEESGKALHSVTDRIPEYEQMISDLLSGEYIESEGLSGVLDKALDMSGYEGASFAEPITSGLENSMPEITAKTQETTTAMTDQIATTVQENAPTVEAALVGCLEGGIANSVSNLDAAIEGASNQSAEALGRSYATQLMTGVESGINSTVTTAKTTFARYVSDLIAELGKLKTEFDSIVTSAKNMTRDVNNAVAGITNGKTVTITIKHNTSAAVDEINRQLKKIGSGLNITLRMTVMGKGGVIKAFANGGVIPAAANGLSIDSGQLFIAREAGPELVAGIGRGRTAVMNNNQIVESVSNGVYQAVVDAMGTQQNDSGDIVLMLGDKEVYRASKRGEKASGYTLTSNPSFA